MGQLNPDFLQPQLFHLSFNRRLLYASALVIIKELAALCGIKKQCNVRVQPVHIALLDKLEERVKEQIYCGIILAISTLAG